MSACVPGLVIMHLMWQHADMKEKNIIRKKFSMPSALHLNHGWMIKCTTV